MVDDKSDAIVIHVGKNDILNHANHENIAHSIINVGLDCKTNGVDEVLISSVLVKKNPNLTAIVRGVNDMLREISVRKMVLVLFAMMLLQLIIYGKMVFTCRTWEHIFLAIIF